MSSETEKSHILLWEGPDFGNPITNLQHSDTVTIARENDEECVSIRRRDIEDLLEALVGVCDAGPPGFGWKSDELERLVGILEQAVDSANGGEKEIVYSVVTELRAELKDADRHIVLDRMPHPGKKPNP